MKKFLKWLLITVAALLALVILAVSIALSPRVLTRIVNRVASEFVDGTASVGRARITLLRTFPEVSVELDSILVTYPHDKFAAYDTVGIWSALLDEGRGESVDTLASIGRLKAGVDAMKFLRKGEIDAEDILLSDIRSFAHVYDSLTANWSIINIPSSDDTTSSPLPRITANGIRIKDIRSAVYTCPRDTMFLGVWCSESELDGKLGITSGEVDVTADILLDARVHLHNSPLGIIDAPVRLETDGDLEVSDVVKIVLGSVKAQVDCLPVEGNGTLIFASDSTYVGAHALIDGCPVGELIDDYGKRYVPMLADLDTDARMTLDGNVDGWFGASDGKLPLMDARLDIPEAGISYSGLVDKGLFDLAMAARCDSDGLVRADLEDLCFAIDGLDLNASGKAEDVLGDDPRMSVKATARAGLASLARYLPAEAGINASGNANLNVSGAFRLSQLNLANINRTTLNGRLCSDGISFSMPRDTLFAFASHTDISAKADGKSLSASADIDSVRFVSGESLYMMGKQLALEAKSKGRAFSKAGKVQPLDAIVKAGSFNMRSSDDLILGIRDSENRMSLEDVKDSTGTLPKLSVDSDNRIASVRSGAHRANLTNTSISASIQKRSKVIGSGRSRPRDASLGRRPMPDSLRGRPQNIPDYLKELDFRKKDLRIDIAEGLSTLFRQWNPKASVKVSRGSVATPVLPLRNNVRGLDLDFNENQLIINSLGASSGGSDVSLYGRLHGIKPLLSGRSSAQLAAVFHLNSAMLDANELIAALDAGKSISASTSLDDAAYAKSLALEGLGEQEQELDYSLIIVPANLNANIYLDVDSVRYSSLAFGDFTSHIRMRERCLQLTNTSATSPLGNASVDAFYSTKSKQDISAGFNVKLDDITADRIIELVPAVDSLVPMLKSFKGLLNCELAATSQLDTNMNIQIPTINGIVKIGGSGLELSDTGDLRRIAQLLMFKDAKVGHIDDMTVNGIIADNTLEVFPFLLGVDRYTLGLSGVQGFDQNFKYHISVIKSPLPFKFGINLKGNFDNWNFSVGKAKYKSTKIPLFTPEVDSLQVNLIASIKDIYKKGVEGALREVEQNRQRAEERRDREGIFRDDDDGDDELTESQLEQIDSYLLDAQCEAETEELDQELDAMLEEDLNSMIASLLSDL